MKKQFYKTVLQIEVLSEDPIVAELPVDKLLSYLEYQGTFGHNSNYVSVVGEQKLTVKELELECAKHGTDPSFFTGLGKETCEEPDEHASSLGI